MYKLVTYFAHRHFLLMLSIRTLGFPLKEKTHSVSLITDTVLYLSEF